MPPLSWSPRALRDIARLHQFLAIKSRRAADRAITTIRTAAQVLREFPELGRVAEDSEFGYRELLVPYGDSGYVVAYARRADFIEILDVRHQREAGY